METYVVIAMLIILIMGFNATTGGWRLYRSDRPYNRFPCFNATTGGWRPVLVCAGMIKG